VDLTLSACSICFWDSRCLGRSLGVPLTDVLKRFLLTAPAGLTSQSCLPLQHAVEVRPATDVGAGGALADLGANVTSATILLGMMRSMRPPGRSAEPRLSMASGLSAPGSPSPEKVGRYRMGAKCLRGQASL
jgi:hypothetical protein